MAVDWGGWAASWDWRGQSKTSMVGRFGFVGRLGAIAGDSQKRRLAACATGVRRVAAHGEGEFWYSVAPMIDLGFFRSHLDDIEVMARNRGGSLDLGRFREIDSERRSLITSVEDRKSERNAASLEIAGLKKSGGGG